MPRKTTKQKKLEKRTASLLIILLGTVFMAAIFMAIPNAWEHLSKALGITQRATVPLANSNSNIAVHIIDIGQGDAVLLEDSGEFALIDTGPRSSQDKLLAYLKAAGVKKLRYAIMTHPHEDHMGNMEAVLSFFEVEEIVLPQLDKAPYPTTSFFLSLLEALQEKHIPTRVAQENDILPLGVGEITVLQAGLASENNYNLLSLILLFESEGMRFLNTGDAEKPNEQALLNCLKDISADVYLAGHHGSSTSNSDAFMRAVRPAVTVISCSADNSYGHPHREPLASFSQINSKVIRTDLNGSIVIKPNGDSIAFGCEFNDELAPAA